MFGKPEVVRACHGGLSASSKFKVHNVDMQLPSAICLTMESTRYKSHLNSPPLTLLLKQQYATPYMFVPFPPCLCCHDIMVRVHHHCQIGVSAKTAPARPTLQQTPVYCQTTCFQLASACKLQTSRWLVLLHTTYTCAFKPGCLMSHNWPHTPVCKESNEQ